MGAALSERSGELGCGLMVEKTFRPLCSGMNVRHLYLARSPLEIFGLGIDPVNRQLVPVEALMLRHVGNEQSTPSI